MHASSLATKCTHMLVINFIQNHHPDPFLDLTKVYAGHCQRCSSRDPKGARVAAPDPRPDQIIPIRPNGRSITDRQQPNTGCLDRPSSSSSPWMDGCWRIACRVRSNRLGERLARRVALCARACVRTQTPTAATRPRRGMGGAQVAILLATSGVATLDGRVSLSVCVCPCLCSRIRSTLLGFCSLLCC